MKRSIFLSFLLLISTPCFAGTISISPFLSGNDVSISHLESQRSTLQNVINGNIRKAPGGYLYIKDWYHPLANCKGDVMHHRVVMEKHIGSFLPRKEIFHHLNHIKPDKEIENLELVESHSKHLSEHHRNINLGRKLTPEHREKVIKTLNWYKH